ncbi:MAG: hypothetical protein HY094_01035 [Candidatus Melainabacteria bacterium]|nr:hypothetical protein [Candidatus Melainabacteria bacterium]
MLKLICSLILCAFLFFQPLFSCAVFEKIDGLEYDVRKIDDAPMDKVVSNRYDLYELYFENRSEKTFSVPGYSIDLGVNYSSISEINSLFNGKLQKKLTALNIAAGAASIVFGGIAKTAANSAMRTVNFRKKNNNLDDDNSFLSHNKTYILYPGDALSLFLFVDKALSQVPNTIRFVCHDEDSNVNQIVINNHLKLREAGVQNNADSIESNKDSEKTDKLKDNVIAVPATEIYK